MKSIEVLNKYFLAGSAEREQEIRNDVFIKTPSIDNFYSEIHNSFILLKSQKGIGKTFFIDEFCSSAISNNIITLKVRPEDFDMEKISSVKSIAAKSKAAYEFLIKAISAKIGEAIHDESLSGIEYNNLLEIYKNSATYQPSLAEKSLRALKHIPIESYQKIVTGLSKISDEFFRPTESTEVLSGDISRFVSNKEQRVFVFIDDIDNAQNFTDISRQSKFEDCWAIISAGFDLATKISNVKCVVSIRDDIWMTIRKLRIGSDKTDKITCIADLTCTDEDIYKILNKRISLATNALQDKKGQELHNFFNGDEVTLPGINNEKRPWKTWLCKQSRNRPRDLIQLVEMLIRGAKRKKSIITSDVVKECLVRFGESRLKNAQDEFSGICDQLEDITRKFRQTRYSYTELTEFLKNMPSSLTISVNGKTLQPNKIESAIEILSVLYTANIVNARVADNTRPLGFGHITFEERNNFITMANVQELQKCEFEIHPVFHSLIASFKKL